MAPPKPRLTAMTIWAALLAGPTLFLGVALLLVHGVAGGVGLGGPIHDLLVPIGSSAILSVVTVALSWLWAVRMALPAPRGDALRAGAIPPGPDTNALTRMTVACALCEGGALCAGVVFLFTGAALALGPFALSWLALAAHFPGEGHWARLGGDAVRSGMIRG